MPPPPHTSKRMTANPVRPARYRPGKAVAEESSSEEEDEDDDEVDDEQDNQQQTQSTSKQPPPKATSFPSSGAGTVISKSIATTNANERKRIAEEQERARRARERAEREKLERDAGFVTESESEDEDDEGEQQSVAASLPSRPSADAPATKAGTTSSEEESGSEESDSDSDSSDSPPPPKLLRPKFIPKSQRGKSASEFATAEVEQAKKEEDEAVRRQNEADALVKERIERDAAARAAGKKNWDDDEVDEADAVDDTDDLDPELEHTEWVARELGRLKRARAKLEEREAEIAERERRENMTEEDRRREDEARVATQQEEKKERGPAGYMQRYFHKGGFFQDQAEELGLDKRNLMGAKFVDQYDKSALPEYLQRRDQTKIGKKGGTRYKDLKSEDTGRWGAYDKDDRRRPGAFDRRDGERGHADVTDDRFRPDYEGPSGGTGANASSMGDKRRLIGGDDGRDSKKARYDKR